jgi:hypothetical protein
VGSGAQLLPLPWTDINQIKVVFNENVMVDKADLSLAGANLSHYDTAGGLFSYDPATFTATWTLPGYLGDDKLALRLSADQPGAIRDIAGNRLDGEWTNPASITDTGTRVFPSGNGVAGADFLFRFNVLPGDVNQNGYVQSTDGLLMRGALGSTAGQAAYAIFKALDGDGQVRSSDVLLAHQWLGKALPAAEPPSTLRSTGFPVIHLVLLEIPPINKWPVVAVRAVDAVLAAFGQDGGLPCLSVGQYPWSGPLSQGGWWA